MRLALLALVAGLFAPPAFADPVDDVIRAQMARSDIPGAAVAVVENGKVAKLAGYGLANLEWQAPVDPDTTFQIASATKLFTGIVLMRLVERGELSLNDPLLRYYPDGPESWRGITVLQLANHTSGLTQGFGANNQHATLDEVLAATRPLPLVHAPGARSQYGLTDFILLQGILEKVSGKALPELFADEIFRPLGLTRTRFSHAVNRGALRWSDVLPGRASVYAFEGGEQHVSDLAYREITYAAGGLFSSARDMATVFAALDDGRLLKPESLRLLETPPTLTDGGKGGFGVGWTTRTYRGVRIVGHSGGPALADVVRVEDRKLTIIVLTNQQRFYPLLAERVADLYLPDGPRVKTIADRRPALTAAMARVFSSAEAGAVDPALFTVTGAAQMVPFFGEMRSSLLRAVGPYRSAELLTETVADGKATRKYRVVFETRELFWRLTADRLGLIEELIPVGEAD
jgi:CubicO group peptidase (beta-lactamase class C family)